ncbi:unnamed protein product [Rotaria sp. Silwood2]|nr:unnamed protein product [Rotaria sp. Silwood2]CAF2937291.1 unnamed protein product [Rotaria sp. Silwood2]CAF3325867.1 unnamed protein product [Rotaria sp. Silwood2]CAF3999629.1 unnamed protein product [Rotaria sp. Silwood2]CAF4011664.1 unnamed protein product [Rotaria sp. Silwood2]
MFLTLVLVVILLILYHQIRSLRYFSSRSTPGPHPSLFFGNLRQLWKCQSISRQLQLWTQKYGPIYGFYEGAYQRIWVVSDVNFLEDVFIRQFSLFTSRKPIAIFLNPNEKYPNDIVQADVYSLHYSFDLWGPIDPALFYPDRHLTQQSQSAFLTFGLGPRQCIGMRFAMLVIKLTLIRLLKEHTMVQSNKLEENWRLNDKRVITPQNCWIRLEKRQ